MKDPEAIFVEQGGDFTTLPLVIRDKLQDIKAFIFDWDGVFNSGRKGKSSTSDFTEGDAMGINMLRFSWYLTFGFNPRMFIVTGAKNPSAIEFVNREHFDAVFFRFLNKVELVPFLEDKFGLKPSQCAFIFDDILDLSLAAKSGLRFYVKKTSNPMLTRYIANNKLCDYITGHDGDHNAIREICEMVMCLNNNYDTALSHRIEFSTEYTQFYDARNELKPAYFIKENNTINTINKINPDDLQGSSL